MQENLQNIAFGTYQPSAAEQMMIDLARLCPENWLGKRLAFLLRKIAMKTFAMQPRDIEVLGAKMRLQPADNVAEKRLLYTPQYFDKTERAYLSQVIEQSNADFVFIDIGANVGGYSLFVAAQAGAEAKILAIEPQPEMFARLSFNIRQNPFGTIKALDCAIADQEGTMRLFLAPDNRGEASLKLLSADPNAGHAVDVQTKTLLGIVEGEKLQHIDAIKIDIEGAEDIALMPFFNTAPQALWPKHLILEIGVGRWQSDLLQFLLDKGYQLHQQTRLNFILTLG